MSDEPASSGGATAAGPSSGRSPASDENGSTAERATPQELKSLRKTNAQLMSRKRTEFLLELLRNLDILVYAELSTIYYMDCSFLRFLLRCFVQFVFLTPKPKGFPDPGRERPFVGTVLMTNLFCVFVHAYFSAPSAGEATRGYLHGGLIMDFVGQKGPSSKFHLLILDVVVLLLQLAQTSVEYARRQSSSKPASSEPAAATASAPAAGTSTAAAAPPRQDLDAEERGVRRSGEGDEIELRDLNPSLTSRAAEATVQDESGAEADGHGSTESQSLLPTESMLQEFGSIFDAMNSGQIVIANVNIWRTFKEQFRRRTLPQTGQASDVLFQLLRARLSALAARTTT